MSARVTRSIVMAAFTVIAAAPLARAQEAQGAIGRRPYRGLFGAGDAARGDRPSMTLLFSTFGAYDDTPDITRADRDRTDRSPVDPGVQADVTFVRPGKRFQLGWTVDADARRYAVADGFVAVRGATTVAWSGRLTRRTSMQIAQRLEYSPQSLFSALPQSQEMRDGIDATAAMPGNRVRNERSANADSTAGLTYAPGDRSTFSGHYGYHRAASIDDRSVDTFANRIGGRFTQKITRDISARLGYGLRVAEHTTGGVRRELRTHDLDIGVDYRRGLSLTRRTRLNFSTGTTVVRADGHVEAGVIRIRTQIRAIGAAEVVSDFGRTWTTRLAYDRGVQYSDLIAAPALTDTVVANLGGFLGRRLGVNLSAGFTMGHVGLGAEANPYESLTGVLQLQYAVTRRWALVADYGVFEYRFATTEQLPARLPVTRRYSSARVGLTWRVPVLR